MNNAPTTPVATGTLAVSGARLHYEVRGEGPALLLAAAPMDARSFAPAADLLAADFTVITTDPRGINRSPVDVPDQDSTPEMRAADLSELLKHLGTGPAAVFGSSGGAVTVLALAQAHPEQVHTVVAHEPPLSQLLDDRDDLNDQTEDMIATYLSGDVRGAWVKFMKAANIYLPDQVFDMMFGGERDAQTAADERFQFAHMLRATTHWQPDIAAIRSGESRILVGIGEDSAGQLCDRASIALAAALGVEPTMFPGGHIAFADDPAVFARRLREVLA